MLLLEFNSHTKSERERDATKETRGTDSPAHSFPLHRLPKQRACTLAYRRIVCALAWKPRAAVGLRPFWEELLVVWLTFLRLKRAST